MSISADKFAWAFQIACHRSRGIEYNPEAVARGFMRAIYFKYVHKVSPTWICEGSLFCNTAKEFSK
jgi:hypothetical protein